MVLNSHTRNHSLQDFNFTKFFFVKCWINLFNFPPQAAYPYIPIIPVKKYKKIVARLKLLIYKSVKCYQSSFNARFFC